MPPTYDDSSGPRRKERVGSDYWHLTEFTHLRANKKKHDVFTGQANADVLIDLARRGLTGDERTVDDEIAEVEQKQHMCQRDIDTGDGVSYTTALRGHETCSAFVAKLTRMRQKNTHVRSDRPVSAPID